MDFVDQTLIRLAAPETRAAVFDQLALEHLVAAGYDADSLGINGPYQPSFDDFRLGVALAATPRFEGTWQQPGRGEITELRVTVTGLAGDPVRIEGLWRGSIIARAGTVESPITQVQGQWDDLRLDSIDAEIVAALGALPAGPQLEQERKARLLERFRQGLVHPNAVTDTTLSTWLRAQGAESVGGVLARSRGQLGTAGLTVTMAPPSPVPALPRPLPVTVALLIRDAGTSIVELLALSCRVRERLGSLGVERVRGAGMRQGILIAWILPAAVMADAGWPGADAPARRRGASSWLGAEGVALVPVT